MVGAIIGDIVGSRFEWHNKKSKKFQLFTDRNRYTDDTVMTLAIAKSLMESNGKDDLFDIAVKNMQIFGLKEYTRGFGGSFKQWLKSFDPKPYGSFGNGAAMRISPVGWAGKSLDEVKELSRIVTETTHSHPEGIKGAEAVSTMIFLALNGASKEELRNHASTYYYLNFTLDDIRPAYKFDVTCQGSIPQAITAFLESTDFEDAIRNAISIGGDSDTIAAIAAAIAEAFYGVPDDIRNKMLFYVPSNHINLINEFEKKYASAYES